MKYVSCIVPSFPIFQTSQSGSIEGQVVYQRPPLSRSQTDSNIQYSHEEAIEAPGSTHYITHDGHINLQVLVKVCCYTEYWVLNTGFSAEYFMIYVVQWFCSFPQIIWNYFKSMLFSYKKKTWTVLMQGIQDVTYTVHSLIEWVSVAWQDAKPINL